MLLDIEDRTRSLDDLTLRAIVGIEYDELRRRPSILEISNILRIRSLEFVDRLIIISDGEDIWSRLIRWDHREDQLHLSFISVLVLVDQDILILLREMSSQIRTLSDESDRREDHIREINIPFSTHAILILSIDIQE